MFLYYFLQVFHVHRRQPDVLHQGTRMRTPRVRVMWYPRDHSLEDGVLRPDVDEIRGEIGDESRERYAHEFVVFHHRWEVLEGELVRVGLQDGTAVHVCEIFDAEAVGGVEMAPEEGAAGVYDLRVLEQRPSR